MHEAPTKIDDLARPSVEVTKGLEPKVEKFHIPVHLDEPMRLYREGLAPLPREFINLHASHAYPRLEQLRERYGFRVLFSEMQDEGWGDGMLVLRAVIETKRLKRLVDLKWHPGNQDFMVKLQGGGHGIAYERDVSDD